MRIFGSGPRTDSAPKRHNEDHYTFYDRCAVGYFGDVRDLLQAWLDHVPQEHQAALVGALQSRSDAAFESALWELYLHEAYVRSGHEVTIHPDVAAGTKHPDFLVQTPSTRFYVEAVRVGQAPHVIACDRRLAEVYAVLDTESVERFVVSVTSYDVGSRPLATRPLRRALRQWLEGLDPDAVTAAALLHPGVGMARLPILRWEHDGWRIEFHAMPLSARAAGKRMGLLGALGPGRAVMVDNLTGLRRALDSKANRYGHLDSPLVIAVLANSEYPTKDYEVEQALFGVSARRPALAAEEAADLFEDGHWLTSSGWRRGHAPQVIVAQGLGPSGIGRVVPRLWETLQSGVPIPTQPGWLARADVYGEEVAVIPGDETTDLFGLPPDWIDRRPEWPAETLTAS